MTNGCIIRGIIFVLSVVDVEYYKYNVFLVYLSMY